MVRTRLGNIVVSSSLDGSILFPQKPCYQAIFASSSSRCRSSHVCGDPRFAMDALGIENKVMRFCLASITPTVSIFRITEALSGFTPAYARVGVALRTGSVRIYADGGRLRTYPMEPCVRQSRAQEIQATAGRIVLEADG